jgi:hypothetical protein
MVCILLYEEQEREIAKRKIEDIDFKIEIK